MAEVVLTEVRKSYGKLDVVHDMNLEIPDKEFVVFVGPSGCGKSTTLRMIAGLETITGGTVQIGDKVVNDIPPRGRNIAMVFQDYALYPHMTVAGNLGFGLKVQGMSRTEINRRVSEAAETLGLTDLLRRKPGQLSGGQRQRVAMGRAIVREPEVYLFDEPLSNLDAKLRTQMRAEVKRLHRRVGNTIIYVTHDQVEAMTLADRIVIMRDGVIEQVGTPRDVFERPANTFVATFIGSPPMNLIDVELDRSGPGPLLRFGDGQTLPLPEQFVNMPGLPDRLSLGVRPEDITPVGHGLEHDGETRQLTFAVDLAEDLGSEAILSVRVGSQLIQSTMYHPLPIAPGQTLSFDVALNKLHLFDPHSGDRI